VARTSHGGEPAAPKTRTSITPDAPKTLPTPLRGVVWAEAARRFTRAGTPELNGFPVGQIVGRMNARRPGRGRRRLAPVRRSLAGASGWRGPVRTVGPQQEDDDRD
jgi:hypothetical protein